MDQGIEYDSFGRMKYNPEFHPNNKKQMYESDYEYLCRFYEVDDIKTLSMAMGRSETSLYQRVSYLKKIGLYEHYKNLRKHWC